MSDAIEVNSPYDEDEGWRDSPRKHRFIPQCGSSEGVDECWLCGNPEIVHAEFVAESAKATPSEA